MHTLRSLTQEDLVQRCALGSAAQRINLYASMRDSVAVDAALKMEALTEERVRSSIQAQENPADREEAPAISQVQLNTVQEQEHEDNSEYVSAALLEDEKKRYSQLRDAWDREQRKMQYMPRAEKTAMLLGQGDYEYCLVLPEPERYKEFSNVMVKKEMRRAYNSWVALREQREQEHAIVIRSVKYWQNRCTHAAWRSWYAGLRVKGQEEEVSQNEQPAETSGNDGSWWKKSPFWRRVREVFRKRQDNAVVYDERKGHGMVIVEDLCQYFHSQRNAGIEPCRGMALVQLEEFCSLLERFKGDHIQWDQVEVLIESIEGHTTGLHQLGVGLGSSLQLAYEKVRNKMGQKKQIDECQDTIPRRAFLQRLHKDSMSSQLIQIVENHLPPGDGEVAWADIESSGECSLRSIDSLVQMSIAFETYRTSSYHCAEAAYKQILADKAAEETEQQMLQTMVLGVIEQCIDGAITQIHHREKRKRKRRRHEAHRQLQAAILNKDEAAKRTWASIYEENSRVAGKVVLVEAVLEEQAASALSPGKTGDELHRAVTDEVQACDVVRKSTPPTATAVWDSNQTKSRDGRALEAALQAGETIRVELALTHGKWNLLMGDIPAIMRALEVHHGDLSVVQSAASALSTILRKYGTLAAEHLMQVHGSPYHVLLRTMCQHLDEDRATSEVLTAVYRGLVLHGREAKDSVADAEKELSSMQRVMERYVGHKDLFTMAEQICRLVLNHGTQRGSDAHMSSVGESLILAMRQRDEGLLKSWGTACCDPPAVFRAISSGKAVLGDAPAFLSALQVWGGQATAAGNIRAGQGTMTIVRQLCTTLEGIVREYKQNGTTEVGRGGGVPAAAQVIEVYCHDYDTLQAGGALLTAMAAGKQKTKERWENEEAQWTAMIETLDRVVKRLESAAQSIGRAPTASPIQSGNATVVRTLLNRISLTFESVEMVDPQVEKASQVNREAETVTDVLKSLNLTKYSHVFDQHQIFSVRSLQQLSRRELLTELQLPLVTPCHDPWHNAPSLLRNYFLLCNIQAAVLALIRWRYMSSPGNMADELPQVPPLSLTTFLILIFNQQGEARSLSHLLRQLDLTQYESTFAAAEIDLELLLFITKDELRALKLPLGPRTALEKYLTSAARVARLSCS